MLILHFAYSILCGTNLVRPVNRLPGQHYKQ